MPELSNGIASLACKSISQRNEYKILLSAAQRIGVNLGGIGIETKLSSAVH